MRYSCLCGVLLFAVSVPAHADDRKESLRRSVNNIAQMDANKDGTVTRGELNSARASMFARYDQNKDNVLSSDDIPAAMALMGANAMFDSMKKTFDANKDGKISRAEFMGGPTPGFNFADANRDNQVTKVERETALTKLK